MLTQFKNDNKVTAMYDLIQELRYAPYEKSIIKEVLTLLEKEGIKYLLDDLPEGKSYNYYCEYLDNYIVNLFKKEQK